MQIKNKRPLLAAGIFAGALCMLAPLTLFAEAGKAAPPEQPKTVTVKPRTTAKRVATKKPVPKTKALVKVKRSVARKFLPVAHMGDY